jgi:hypothetical protein
MQALVIRPRHSISGSIVLMWSADLSATESNDSPNLVLQQISPRL